MTKILLFLLIVLIPVMVAAEDQHVAVLIDVSGSMPQYLNKVKNWQAQLESTILKLLTGNGAKLNELWNFDPPLPVNESEMTPIQQAIYKGTPILAGNPKIVIIPFGDISTEIPFFSNKLGPENKTVDEITSWLNREYFKSVWNMMYNYKYNQLTHLALSPAVAWDSLNRPQKMITIVISDFARDGIPEGELPKSAQDILNDYSKKMKPQQEIRLLWKEDRRVILKVEHININELKGDWIKPPPRQVIKVKKPLDGSTVGKKVLFQWEQIKGITQYKIKTISIDTKGKELKELVKTVSSENTIIDLPEGKYKARIEAMGTKEVYSPWIFFTVRHSINPLKVFSVIFIVIMIIAITIYILRKRKKAGGVRND